MDSESMFYKPEGMSRREFARELSKWGLALGVPSALLSTVTAFGEDPVADMEGTVTDVNPDTGQKDEVPPENMVEVDQRYYKVKPDKTVQCFVCARH